MSFGLSISYNNGRSGYGCNRPTLAAVLEEASKMRAFYEAMYPGTVHAEFFVHCEVCNGNGRIAKGRKNVRFPKYVDCKACNGGSLPLPLVG